MLPPYDLVKPFIVNERGMLRQILSQGEILQLKPLQNLERRFQRCSIVAIAEIYPMRLDIVHTPIKPPGRRIMIYTAPLSY